MSAMATEHVVPDPPRYTACIARKEANWPQFSKAGLREECRQEYWSLKQRALEYLIASEQLLGEAAEEASKRSSNAATPKQQAPPPKKQTPPNQTARTTSTNTTSQPRSNRAIAHTSTRSSKNNKTASKPGSKASTKTTTTTTTADSGLSERQIAQERWEDFRARMDAHPRVPHRAAGHDAP
jgi:hypothetical protein